MTGAVFESNAVELIAGITLNAMNAGAEETGMKALQDDATGVEVS